MFIRLMRGSARGPRGGFTLVEIIVVIAVIGTLISLTVPAVQASLAASRRMTCRSNLHQIGVALDRYIETKGIYPDAAELPSFTPNKPTMVTVLGPYIENDTKSFCCPDDTQYFNVEGLSYEYRADGRQPGPG